MAKTCPAHLFAGCATPPLVGSSYIQFVLLMTPIVGVSPRNVNTDQKLQGGLIPTYPSSCVDQGQNDEDPRSIRVRGQEGPAKNRAGQAARSGKGGLIPTLYLYSDLSYAIDRDQSGR